MRGFREHGGAHEEFRHRRSVDEMRKRRGHRRGGEVVRGIGREAGVANVDERFEGDSCFIRGVVCGVVGGANVEFVQGDENVRGGRPSFEVGVLQTHDGAFKRRRRRHVHQIWEQFFGFLFFDGPENKSNFHVSVR